MSPQYPTPCTSAYCGSINKDDCKTCQFGHLKQRYELDVAKTVNPNKDKL